MPGMFDLSALESEPEAIGTYRNDDLGAFLREGLNEKYPATTIEVRPIEKEGIQLYEMVVRTDPITVSEMRAFVGGFFRAYNNRHKLG